MLTPTIVGTKNTELQNEKDLLSEIQ